MDERLRNAFQLKAGACSQCGVSEVFRGSSIADAEIVGVDTMKNLPPLCPEIIEGIARKGAKILLTGASKAGKTFALIELAIAFAFGMTWFGLRCEKSSVLYVNLELEEIEFRHRFRSTLDKLGHHEEVSSHVLGLLNLRGKVSDAKELVDTIIQKTSGNVYDVIIIDPIYKVQRGDENSAQAITAFAHELDRLAETGCTVVYSHHHPKYTRSGAQAIDRGAGSGVFARDADAIIDMMEIGSNPDRDTRGIPFKLEFVLRSFPFHAPVHVFFRDGLHIVDEDELIVSKTKAGRANRQVRLEAILDELLDSENRISAKDLRAILNNEDGDYYLADCKDARSIKGLLGSSKSFEWIADGNKQAWIVRSESED